MSRAEKKLRRPPAYRCYGSDLMNDQRYFLLTAAQRGLFDSIRNVCWTNDSAPSDPTALAFAARLPADGVREDLAVVLKSGLVVQLASDPNRLHVPELTDQMQEYLAQREQKAESGAKGGRATQDKYRQTKPADPSSTRSSDRSSDLKCTEQNCDDMTGTDLKGVYRDASNSTVDELPVDLDRSDDRDEFVREYDEEEARMHADLVSGRPPRLRGEATH